jgi:DNA-binding NarL/FixJ family response regulator
MDVETAITWVQQAEGTGESSHAVHGGITGGHKQDPAASLAAYPEAAGQESQIPLTRREREIASLIGQGKSNKQIADELVMSERTVEWHASNILSKLDLQSRAQVAVWAVRQGLASPSWPDQSDVFAQ